MKMSSLEKRLVNGGGHSRNVAENAVRSLETVPHRAGEKYLDVGCGNGAAALLVARTSRLEVTGVDVDPEQIRAAREASQESEGGPAVRFEVADATRLPFEDETFDIVASFKTMHHVPEWKQALTEMARVLKPGGRLIVADLVLPTWLAAIARPLVGDRASVLTRDALICLIEAQGLDVIRQRRSDAVVELVGRRPCGFRRCAR